MRNSQKSWLFLGLLLLNIGFVPQVNAENISWPLQQKSGGFTLSLNKAAWCHSSQVAVITGGRATEDISGLGLWFDVKSNQDSPPVPGKKLRDYVQSIKAISDAIPYGESNFEQFKERDTAWCGSVNPRAEKIGVAFELLDPAAPPDALGEWVQKISFTKVPLPKTDGKILKLNRVLATRHGTQVVLEKAALRDERLVFTMRLKPPVSIPDMKSKFVADEYNYKLVLPVISDDKGTNLSGAKLETEPIDKLEEDRPDWEWPVTVKTALPSAGAQTFNVEVKVKEAAPSLKQWQWFHMFHFDLPCREIKQLPYLSMWAGRDELAVVEKPELRASLEAIKPDYGNWQFRFWWQDKQKPPAYPDQKWRLKKMFGLPSFSDVDNSGNVSAYPLFWKIDGTIPLPDESGQFVTIAGEKQQQKLTLTAQLEAVRFRRFAVDLTDIPIPAPGQSLLLNAEKTTPFGSKIRLLQIIYVNTRQPMHGLTENETDNLWLSRHAGFLAAIVEVERTTDCEMDMNYSRIEDEKGHDLDIALDGLNIIQDSNPYVAASRTKIQRGIYSFAPVIDARRLNLHLICEETKSLNRSETIVFSEVKAPVP